MAGITLQNVNKIYDGDVHAVKDFSLDIADKEFVVLVGPSGCGKSTVLRMIAGLEEVSTGELYIGGRLVNDVPPRDRDIAMVFQNYALYPHMTVYKNMAFGLENRKMPKKDIDEKVRAAAKLLGIEDLLKRKPRAMSGGQRQRVALGRAMVREPEVFLLDEPLSNLDAKLRASTRTEISKLHKRLDATFVYVTHDQVEAMTMGDRIVVMKDGVMQQTDTPQNLYDHPCNLFVASFIGTPQMNFIDAELNHDSQGWYACVAGSPLYLPADNERLSACTGRPIVLGIRPDQVSIDPSGALSARVEAVEALGSETYVYLDLSDTQITLRRPGTVNLRVGDTVPLHFSAAHIHLFDKETKLRI